MKKSNGKEVYKLEYQEIALSELKPFKIRDTRRGVLDRLKERIASGYNPARPLSVIKDNGHYLTADGNHRLEVLQGMGISSVQCIVYPEGTDPYSLAVSCNQDEDTYAPMDLFDWLDVVGRLREEGLTQAKIGERIGWGESAIKQYSVLLNKIVTQVLNLAKQHQEGRETQKVTNVTFNFTEGWFRNSGLYDLAEQNQLELMQWFIDSKFPASKKVAERSAWLKLKQDAALYVQDHLIEGADEDSHIVSNINKGLYKDISQVERAVQKTNEQFLDRQKIQIVQQDGLDMLASLTSESVDCIITDPPYNVTSNDWDQFESAQAYLDFLRQYLNEFKRVLKPEYHLFIFVDPEYMARVELLIQDVGIPINSRIIWVRKNISLGRVVQDRFISQWEPVFHCGTKPLAFPKTWGDERGDVQEYAVPQSNFTDKKEHPTQKPLELIKRLVSLATDIGDMVVDPFCGGGTTAKACEELNRKCITSDISKDYIDIAKMRVFGGK